MASAAPASLQSKVAPVPGQRHLFIFWWATKTEECVKICQIIPVIWMRQTLESRAAQVIEAVQSLSKEVYGNINSMAANEKFN